MKSRKTFNARLAGVGIAALILAAPLSYPVYAQTSPSGTPERTAPATPLGADPALKMPGTGPGAIAPAAPVVSESKIEKDHLENILAGAKSRGDYAKILEDDGYKIASVNDDKPELLEYEIVKGTKTYEVRLRFDKDDTVAKKIDVTGNMWKAKETKELLKESKQ